MVSDGPPRLVPSPGQDKRLATTVVVGAEGLAEKKGREKTKERKKKRHTVLARRHQWSGDMGPADRM